MGIYDPKANAWDSTYDPAVAMPASSAGSQPGLDGSSGTANGGPTPAGSASPSSPSASNDGFTPPGLSPTGRNAKGNEHSGSSDGSPGSGTPPGKAAGIAMGVIAGLCLVGAAIFAYYRRRRRGRWDRYHPYIRPGGGNGDLNRLRKPSTEMYATVGKGSGGQGAVKRAVSGFVAAPIGNDRRRFDMLRDEESEVWNHSEGTRSPDNRSGWDLVDVESGEDERSELRDGAQDDDEDEMMTESGRGGIGIWKGLYGTTRDHGKGTRASYLGGALGPLVAGGRDSDATELGNGPGEETDADGLATTRPKSDQSSSTASTGVIAVAKRVQRKPAPTFNDSAEDVRTQECGSGESGESSGNNSGASLPTPLNGAFSPDTSAGGQYEPLHRSKTWWDRFRDRTTFVASPGANVPIRDPNPAPSLHAIAEQDPVSEGIAAMAAAAFASQTPIPEEHGRMSPEGRSQSTRSRGTETSSMLEERVRDMVVFVRDPSSHRSGREDSAATGLDGMSDGEGPFSNRMASVQETPGEIAWDGRAFGGLAWTPGLEMVGRSASPEPMVETPVIAPPPPSTLPARLLKRTPTAPPKGPREAPPLPRSRQATAGSTGVRQMVEQFERVSSASAPSSPEQQIMGHHFAPRPTLYVANPDNRSEG
jgi:hypothetical protein